MNSLKEKTVFITGAASGIGRATAARFIDEGAKVFTVDINGESLKAMEDKFGREKFGYLAGSVTDEALVNNAFAICAGKFGSVDILINNAGIGIPTPDIGTTDLDVYRKMIDVNITGVFLASRAALGQMKPKGKGHIITLVSMAGQRTNPGAPIYCASKFGARGFSSGLADQMIKAGIKVSDINPGPVDSNYWGDRDVPRDKFLSVEDVAELILFVASTPEHVVIREINFDSMKWLAK
jgi:NADP-dependent 3-hydroxy acid dehydrogenase YdfG